VAHEGTQVSAGDVPQPGHRLGRVHQVRGLSRQPGRAGQEPDEGRLRSAGGEHNGGGSQRRQLGNCVRLVEECQRGQFT
jgi:hypothetical protein